jgi:small subunit ribosomal protein S17e
MSTISSVTQTPETVVRGFLHETFKYPLLVINAMGRIKTALIKRVTLELMDKYKKDFKPDFDANKPLVSSHALISSKKIRNVIAGYVTRRVKKNLD